MNLLFKENLNRNESTQKEKCLEHHLQKLRLPYP